MKRVAFVSLLALMLVIAVGANLWKRNLTVDDVHVEGNRIVTSGDVLARASISKGQKLFDVDLYAAAKRILENKFIRSAWVSRDAPGRVRIVVEERVPIAAVVTEDILYVDAEGNVLPPAKSENIFDLPVITGALRKDLFVPGRQIVAPDVREGLRSLMTARGINDELYRRISEIHIESGENIILYTAEHGVPVIFGRGDVARKMTRLAGFWREIVSRYGVHEFQYIDLRFEDQVVVRWKRGDGKPEESTTISAIRMDIMHGEWTTCGARGIRTQDRMSRGGVGPSHILKKDQSWTALS
jgi:cell division protein FtsQ